MITSLWFWLALAGGVAAYWSLPVRLRAGFLAALSLGVLSKFDAGSALVTLAFVPTFYYLAPITSKNRAAMGWLLALTALGYLGFFKYFPPLIAAMFGDTPFAQLALPLGISYLTFKLLHYLIEVRRDRIPKHGVDEFACYLLLFPIYSAGPIERFDHFLGQRATKPTREMIAEGLTRITYGLIKKFLIAETIIVLGYRGLTTDSMIGGIDTYGTQTYWRFMFISFMYAYMDFAAYSDIAIGASRLFGLRIAENFNWPIFAINIGDFWKRWHATLANWCQTYIYMPAIGYTRRPAVAVYLTFIVMGLWHAGSPHWVFWGLLHASGIIVMIAWQKRKRQHNWRLTALPWRAAAIGLTMMFVTAGSVFPLMHGKASFYETLSVFLKLFFIKLPL